MSQTLAQYKNKNVSLIKNSFPDTGSKTKMNKLVCHNIQIIFQNAKLNEKIYSNDI